MRNEKNQTKPLERSSKGDGDAVSVVPDADVQDGAFVERGDVVGVGGGQVELNAELLVLRPVLEHLVGDADRRGFQFRLEVFVVGFVG